LLKGAAIPYADHSLQDGVDLTRFRVRATMQQQRWDLSLKPAGGGTIETRVITPSDGIRWLARCELEASTPGAPKASAS